MIYQCTEAYKISHLNYSYESFLHFKIIPNNELYVAHNQKQPAEPDYWDCRLKQLSCVTIYQPGFCTKAGFNSI